MRPGSLFAFFDSNRLAGGSEEDVEVRGIEDIQVRSCDGAHAKVFHHVIPAEVLGIGEFVVHKVGDQNSEFAGIVLRLISVFERTVLLEALHMAPMLIRGRL